MPIENNTKSKHSTPTTQTLGSLVKSARDIMRKDKGLNGDLDRLPMLTWVMFLKFLDDSERMREQEAELAGERFVPAIAKPYRWRDWAAKADGITGDELIAFINQEECIRPDGKRGPGLFAYLRSLSSANGTLDRRDVIATVFKGTINRMINGYLLRDAAGDSGEFYTPRSVVRFMVAVTDPRLGESVLDPACGTGGFFVEAYQHLAAQCKTVTHHRTLQGKSIFGGEAKSLRLPQARALAESRLRTMVEFLRGAEEETGGVL